MKNDYLGGGWGGGSDHPPPLNYGQHPKTISPSFQSSGAVPLSPVYSTDRSSLASSPSRLRVINVRTAPKIKENSRKLDFSLF